MGLTDRADHLPSELSGGKALDFIVRVIGSAKARRLVVIAEGVEDIGTWTRMRQLGADEAQGFLVSRPLPPAALPIWFESWREQPRFG